MNPEENELICKWMNYPERYSTFSASKKFLINNWWYPPFRMSFGVSYDWLMPVIHKIAQTESISKEMKDEILSLNITTPIEIICSRVIKFINKQSY